MLYECSSYVPHFSPETRPGAHHATPFPLDLGAMDMPRPTRVFSARVYRESRIGSGKAPASACAGAQGEGCRRALRPFAEVPYLGAPTAGSRYFVKSQLPPAQPSGTVILGCPAQTDCRYVVICCRAASPAGPPFAAKPWTS